MRRTSWRRSIPASPPRWACSLTDLQYEYTRSVLDRRCNKATAADFASVNASVDKLRRRRASSWRRTASRPRSTSSRASPNAATSARASSCVPPCRTAPLGPRHMRRRSSRASSTPTSTSTATPSRTSWSRSSPSASSRAAEVETLSLPNLEKGNRAHPRCGSALYEPTRSSTTARRVPTPRYDRGKLLAGDVDHRPGPDRAAQFHHSGAAGLQRQGAGPRRHAHRQR